MRKRCRRRGCQVFITRGSYCADHKPYAGSWSYLRGSILERDDYQCRIRLSVCTGRATTVDHINGDPLDNGVDNLRAACRECNSAKGGV